MIAACSHGLTNTGFLLSVTFVGGACSLVGINANDALM